MSLCIDSVCVVVLALDARVVLVGLFLIRDKYVVDAYLRVRLARAIASLVWAAVGALVSWVAHAYAALLVLSVILCIWGGVGFTVDVCRYGYRVKP